MASSEERERLRATFDRASERYHRARPEYPAALFDRLAELTGLEPGDRVLEVGCATGKATLPLARRLFTVTCVELGPALAAAARANLAGFADVEVVEGRFEDWALDGRPPYDAVVAATAWHWVDPAVRYQNAAEVLVPHGFLAFWEASHVFPEGGDPVFREIQEIYEEIGEGLPPGAGYPRPGQLAEQRDDIEASGRFAVVDIVHFDWEIDYDADAYIDLLETFSGHIAMAEWQRERLFGEIRRRLAERPDGRLRRGWGAVLHVAQRVD